MPNQKKIEAVSSIVETLKKYPNFVLVSFGSTPHKKLEELRRTLRETQTEDIVALHTVKNSLFKVAAGKIGKPEVAGDDTLVGQSAVLTLVGDWTSTLKSFFTFGKEFKGLTFKAGVVDGKVYFKDDLVKLAQLPSKTELIAKILMSFKTPQTRLVRSMTFGMQKLVMVLNAKAKQN